MEIRPFRGYRYNSDVVGDAGSCVAPPYDVIDERQQQELYERSPYNIVRVIRGVKNSDDNEQDNVYTRAAASLDEFENSGALRQDDKESIYVYVQEFSINGVSYQRSGFIALGKLQEYGSDIKPHEQTLAGPKADRLNLMQATKSQIGQVFMLYSDPSGTIDELLDKAARGGALLDYTDDAGVVHRLYAISDEQEVATVVQVMSEKGVFIADGHHRYETALNYYRMSGNAQAAYRMMTFVNTRNKGLVVLGTHRLIKKVEGFNVAKLLGQMGEYFDIARLDFGDVVQKKQRYDMMQDALKLELDAQNNAFGMYFNDGAFYVATLREEAKNSPVMQELAEKYSPAWCNLDVSILHKLILENLLGIDEAALTAQTNVEYIKDIGDAGQRAIDKVDSGDGQGLFFVNPTRPEQVEEVAMAGEKMPQKSTFFYPKIFSGLVINRL